MITIVNDDIVNVKADVIVNAANGIGYMGGVLGRFIKFKGVADSIHYATNGTIEREAKQTCKEILPEPGEVYVTSAQSLQAKWIFHAVTMSKPGRKSSIPTVRKCLINVVNTAQKYGATTVAIPLLGTGTGKVSVQEVANLYKELLTPVQEIDFLIVDPMGHLNFQEEINWL